MNINPVIVANAIRWMEEQPETPERDYNLHWLREAYGQYCKKQEKSQ